MKTVYVLGSGFSSTAGLPMSGQILHGIFNNPVNPEIITLKNWLENNFFHQNPDWIDHNRFGEILSRLDLINYYQPLENTNYKNISHFENKLIAAFLTLLNSQTPDILPACYKNFAINLSHLDTIITFNHDQVIEQTLLTQKIKFSYCLSGQLSATEMPLLKLHGSINMFYCPQCHHVFIEKSSCDKCHINLKPLVIAPTFFKNYHLSALRQLWYLALQALSQAEKIVFIGYAMKKDDILSQQLFDFGYRINPTVQKIIVNGPDADISSYENIYEAGVYNTKLQFAEFVEQLFKYIDR